MTEWEALSIKLENTIWRPKAVSIAFTVLALLDQKQLTKRDLAAKMNVKPQYISRIVKGKANITLETLVKLEQALGATIIEIADPTETITCPIQYYYNHLWENRFSSSNHTETNSATTISLDADAIPYANNAA